MTKKAKPCPHCAAGWTLIDGEHWIVKSTSRAHIVIKPCKALAPSSQSPAKDSARQSQTEVNHD